MSKARWDGVVDVAMAEERREDEITLYLKRSEKGSSALVTWALHIHESRI